MDSTDFLATLEPWSSLADRGASVAEAFVPRRYGEGDVIARAGEPVEGLFIITSGAVELREGDDVLARRGPHNTFGERALTRSGNHETTAVAQTDTSVLLLPAERFHALSAREPAVRDFFAGTSETKQSPPSLAEVEVARLMSANPITVAPDTPLADVAKLLRGRKISSVLVTDGGALKGILTIRDISGRVVAERRDPDLPAREVMTADPVTLPEDAIGSDVLHLMMERRIGHVPIVGPEGLVGIVSQTDLTRFQAETSASVVGEVAAAPDVATLARATARIPQLLAQLVGAGNRHVVVTRLITDIADAVTRRLLMLAQAELGAPPVPYLWLACGSQGRREQTGASDQDNCIILDDGVSEADEPYFEQLARFVSDGLDACGYVFCPGDMMATNPRWRQPVRVWRRYFAGWIDKPDPMAQMLASVMFDLRPIGGDPSLHEGLQAETLEAASNNSIFVAHMVSNSLKHHPPLGLLGGLATMRSGEHSKTLDLKLNGVVPIIDLGRIYALRARLTEVNTRARLVAARAAGIISETGGRDLLAAYDLIAETRLEHQARQVREGRRPDNFMPPATLPEFERNHLKNAFQVVRQMQKAATQGRGVM